MFSSYRAAPRAVRRLVAAAAVSLSVLLMLGLVYAYLVYRQMSVAMESYDVFNPASLSFELGPAGELIGGLALSFPATFGGFALLCATRLTQPYRPKARMYVFVGVAAHAVLVAATVAGALIGNRPWDAKTIGTVASLVFVVVLPFLAAHPVVRAWSGPLPVPRPPLPPDAES
jgi:hypothetical protein